MVVSLERNKVYEFVVTGNNSFGESLREGQNIRKLNVPGGRQNCYTDFSIRSCASCNFVVTHCTLMHFDSFLSCFCFWFLEFFFFFYGIYFHFFLSHWWSKRPICTFHFGHPFLLFLFHFSVYYPIEFEISKLT